MVTIFICMRYPCLVPTVQAKLHAVSNKLLSSLPNFCTLLQLHRVNKLTPTVVTSGAGTAYLFGAPEFTPSF